METFHFPKSKLLSHWAGVYLILPETITQLSQLAVTIYTLTSAQGFPWSHILQIAEMSFSLLFSSINGAIDGWHCVYISLRTSGDQHLPKQLLDIWISFLTIFLLDYCFLLLICSSSHIHNIHVRYVYGDHILSIL